jgi:hypothetical protein
MDAPDQEFATRGLVTISFAVLPSDGRAVHTAESLCSTARNADGREQRNENSSREFHKFPLLLVHAELRDFTPTNGVLSRVYFDLITAPVMIAKPYRSL